jgi:hypothetical protein
MLMFRTKEVPPPADKPLRKKWRNVVIAGDVGDPDYPIVVCDNCGSFHDANGIASTLNRVNWLALYHALKLHFEKAEVE